MRSFNDLPDEILQRILFYAPPEDTLIIQSTSKRLNRLANEPLLWRHHCRMSFAYWDSKHRILQKFASNVVDFDWKKIYFYRRDVDSQTSRALDGILARQIDRIEKFESISQFGYDAKDTLLRHCAIGEEVEDVLARRFYSNAVLDHVHRSQALEEWRKLSKGDNIPLERALGAFDLFVLHDEYGDLQEVGLRGHGHVYPVMVSHRLTILVSLKISELLDRLVLKLRAENPDVDDWSPRRRALATAGFLRANNLTGITSELRYRDLQNNYIGIALQDPQHPSLQLISVAIFCGVAQRLALRAHCCGFPNHVHAIIYPNPGEDLDGWPSTDGSDLGTPMYLDPYRSEHEVPVEHLKTQLVAWGVNARDFHRFLGDSSIRNIVLRTSRNILATVHEFRGLGGNTENTGHPTIRLHANLFADMDNAFYSALWANFLLCSPPTRPEPTEQIQFLPMILERFERLYPMDANLIEHFVCPSFRNVAATDQWELFETLRVVRASDSMPKQVRSRDSSTTIDRVSYHVGQIFQHRRYRYIAVIIGWDVECNMNSQWMAQNQIDTLDRGRHQSFYHALVEDTSIRYVAEENIDIIEPEVPISLMSLAGRYFKKWDRERHRFISNIRDEYPDD